MRMTRGRGFAVSAGIALPVMLVVGSGGAASAVGPGEIGSFAEWSMAGSANAFTGTATFPSADVPDATVTSDSVSLAVPSGESAYLGAATAFGAEFGSTRRQPYLTLRPTSGSPAPVPPSTGTPPPSVTTISFDAQPAAGWGFALGDIDADWAFVRAYDEGGVQLPVSSLGAQAPGNYCEDASPRPSTCSAAVAPFDVPNWVAGPGNVDVDYSGTTISYVPGTVYGNFADTAGAYIWFMPDAAVRSIDIMFGALSGSPIYQLWLAQPAPKAILQGTVTTADGSPAPPGTEVQLNEEDGTPVLDIEDQPVRVPVDADGGYEIEVEQREIYELAVIPPPGYLAPAPILVSADDPDPQSFVVEVAPIVVEAEVPVVPETPETPETPGGTEESEIARLPDMGAEPAPLLAAAGTVLLLGTALALAHGIRRPQGIAYRR